MTRWLITYSAIGRDGKTHRRTVESDRPPHVWLRDVRDADQRRLREIYTDGKPLAGRDPYVVQYTLDFVYEIPSGS
jgi:hypothetical protein